MKYHNKNKLSGEYMHKDEKTMIPGEILEL